MIEDIMSEFEFEKVHAFMVINEEKFYKDGEYYTPTVDDVKQVARGLLEDAFDTHQREPDFIYTSVYHFTAEVTAEDGILELYYRPFSSRSFADDLEGE
jgi:hypothetical protein